MPPMITPTSSKQYRVLEDKIDATVNISFPSSLANIPTIAQDAQAPEESGSKTDSTDRTAVTACPKMFNQLLKRTCNISVPGLDGIG
jgi:hypothetical protein